MLQPLHDDTGRWAYIREVHKDDICGVAGSNCSSGRYHLSLSTGERMIWQEEAQGEGRECIPWAVAQAKEGYKRYQGTADKRQLVEWKHDLEYTRGGVNFSDDADECPARGEWLEVVRESDRRRGDLWHGDRRETCSTSMEEDREHDTLIHNVYHEQRVYQEMEVALDWPRNGSFQGEEGQFNGKDGCCE